jgi:hypothetical protein
MERQTPSDNVANSIVAARPWLTLERLLEVLPLKKSYIHHRNAYATDSSDAHRATAAVLDDDCIVAWLEKGPAKMLQIYLVKSENRRWSHKYRTPEGRWTHYSLRTPLSHSTAPVFSFSEATGRARSALLGAAPIPPFRIKRGLSSPRKFTQVGQLAQQAAVVPARHDSAILRSRHSEGADHPPEDRAIRQVAPKP